MLGFETIGNATITVFDGAPILSTDPWIDGKPYFGSWTHKFKIPNAQLENIKISKYIWLSHGHPDHIDPESFDIFKNKIILIPDHYGDRIFNELKKKYKCIKIISNKWFELSKNIRIKSFADWNQDASLIIDINKKDAILNLNDGSGLGWSNTIKKIISNYQNRFLLKLVNWGDADMINIYNHHSEFILPLAAERKPCGESYNYYLEKWNCNHAIPFSSFHKYQREDSFKMNEFITPLKEHYNNFDFSKNKLLPAFIIWNSIEEQFVKINPEENNEISTKPEMYGDNWSDNLEKSDQNLLKDYFLKFDHLKKKFGFISFRVGNKDFNIKLSDRNEGFQFTAPKNSLIFSIKNGIFDDLLIGNFMKTQLINVPSLYPDFTPYVTKYGDNGLSKSEKELKDYFDYYKFNSLNFWIDYLKIKSEDIIRPKLESYKKIYFAARWLKRKLT